MTAPVQAITDRLNSGSSATTLETNLADAGALATTAGNTLVAVVSNKSTTETCTGITDSVGNVWTRVGTTFAAANAGESIDTFIATNANQPGGQVQSIPQATGSFTTSMSASGKAMEVIVTEWPGEWSADEAAIATGDSGSVSSTTPSPLTTTPSQDGSILLARIVYGSNTPPTTGGRFTLIASQAHSSGSANCTATAYIEQTTATEDGADWSTPSTKAAQSMFALAPVSGSSAKTGTASTSAVFAVSSAGEKTGQGSTAPLVPFAVSTAGQKVASGTASLAVAFTPSSTGGAPLEKSGTASAIVRASLSATGVKVAAGTALISVVFGLQSTEATPPASTPSPQTNLSNASTPAAVRALALAHGVTVRHGVDVLSTSDVPTGEVLPFTTGSVTWSYRPPDPLDGQTTDVTAVRRQASLTVPGGITLNVLARRFRLWTEFLLDNGSWARWHLGVFETSRPKVADDGQILTATLDLADKSYRWSQTTLTDPVHLDDTQAAIPWVIADLGTRFGETKFAITGDSTATVGGNGLTFDSGTDLLTLYSAVLGSVGNDQLTTDADGTPASQPLSVIAGKGPSALYGPGKRKIVTAAGLQPLIPNVPNVIRFVARQGPDSGGSEGNGIYTVRNQSTGPASVDARGFEVSLTITVDAADEATLESVGDSEKQRYFAGGGNTFTGQIGLNPAMGDRDVIAIVLPRLGLTDDAAWNITEWVYPLGDMMQSSDALMSITAEQRVA